MRGSSVVQLPHSAARRRQPILADDGEEVSYHLLANSVSGTHQITSQFYLARVRAKGRELLRWDGIRHTLGQILSKNRRGLAFVRLGSMADGKSLSELFSSRQSSLARKLPSIEDQIWETYWKEFERAHRDYIADTLREAGVSYENCGRHIMKPRGWWWRWKKDTSGSDKTVTRLQKFIGDCRLFPSFLLRYGSRSYQDFCRGRAWRKCMNAVCAACGEDSEEISIDEFGVIDRVMRHTGLKPVLYPESMTDGNSLAEATAEQSLNALMAECICGHPAQLHRIIDSPKQFWTQWGPVWFLTRRVIEPSHAWKVD